MPARLIGPRRPTGSFYKKRPTVRNARAPKAKSLTQIIKKVIASESETKYRNEDPLINALFNSAIASTNELYACIPRVERGDEAHMRIGNSITPKTCKIKGTISCAFDTLTSDVMVVMYVFTSVKFKFYPDLQANFNVANMLDNGNGSTISPTGSMHVMNNYPADKQHIRLLAKKSFHLQKGYGSQNGGSSTETGVGGGSQTIRNFDIKIKCPKTLKYDDDNGGRYPTNFSPVVGFGYYHTDGTSPDALSRVVCVNLSSQLYYDDA